GPGGSGKTYLYNTMDKILLGKGKKVLCVAWSAIAATLLPHGQTVHSAFKLPVPTNEVHKTSLMKVQSEEVRKLLNTDVIIWDEAPMAPKTALEAVNMLLKGLTQTSEIFAGKTIVLGGDFRQISPVVLWGSKEE